MLLSAEHLTFTYHQSTVPTLKDASFWIDEGEIKLIAGSSGSGKSTLAFLLAGLYPGKYGELSEGKVLIHKENIASKLPYQRLKQVGIVFQNCNMAFCMNSLREEIRFVLENLSYGEDEIDIRLNELVHSLPIFPFLDKSFVELSEGEKQLSSIAIALSPKPECLILDEPFSHLDEESADALLIYMHKLRYQNKTAIIVIDHVIERWMDVVNEIFLLNREGSFILHGNGKQIFSKYAEEFKRESIVIPFQHNRRRYHERSSELAIVLENFSLWHKNEEEFLLENTQMRIPEGNLVVIYGRSGVGKTTLLEAIESADNYEGILLYKNKDVQKMSSRERLKHISMILQNSSDVFLRDRVIDEVVMSLHMANPKWTFEECAKKGLEQLKQCHLERFVRANPYQLSIGQQRLLLMQMAMLSNHDMLFIDEPTYGQDYDSIHYIMRKMQDEARKGKTIIFTTHNMDIAREYGDVMYEMRDKQLWEVR